MSRNEHPEYLLLADLQTLQARRPEDRDLAEAVDRLRDAINQNAIAFTQEAHLHVLIRKPGDLHPNTLIRLFKMYKAAIESIEDELTNLETPLRPETAEPGTPAAKREAPRRAPAAGHKRKS